MEPTIRADMTERELEVKVNEGLRIAHRKLVEQHRRTNTPLVFGENGGVKFVDPFSVPLDCK